MKVWAIGVVTSLAAPWLFVASPGAQTQQAPRIATSIAAIERYPGFFHGRHIAIVGTPQQVDGLWQIAVTAPRTFVVIPSSGQPGGAAAEIRGLLLDVGRLPRDDMRLSIYGLRPILQTLYGDRWPDQNALLALVTATWTAVPDARTAPLRAVVFHPETFDGRQVTIRGRFRGQNLFGDLPAWPRQSQWDFVLNAADASIWVTGMRPRGRGFDLDPKSRRSTGTWLQATGTIQLENGLPRLQARTIEQINPVDEEPEQPAAAPPPEPPPAVIFSAPVNGERDVSVSTSVRIQFSRDMRGSSFESHVRVTYGDPAEKVPEFTPEYRPLARGLDLKFMSPLLKGATVIVELTDGITASDGTPMAPAKIVFMVER